MKIKMILPLFLLSSCWGIKDDQQVEKDTLRHLKEKYGEGFTVVSVSNNMVGHGKGALWATGNDFTIELNSQQEPPTWFQAQVAYDSNGRFVYYGDTYKEEVIGSQMRKDFTEMLKEGYPKQTTCNLYFQVSSTPMLDTLKVERADYKEILPKYPYIVSLTSASVYFFKSYPASEKEITGYLRKYFMKLQTYKLNSLDMFVYYWDESYVKDNSIDSLHITFGYESSGGNFEAGNAPNRRYRLQLGKEELDHIDTLNLYRWMKDF